MIQQAFNFQFPENYLKMERLHISHFPMLIRSLNQSCVWTKHQFVNYFKVISLRVEEGEPKPLY